MIIVLMRGLRVLAVVLAVVKGSRAVRSVLGWMI
jgi:hypothetical protein